MSMHILFLSLRIVLFVLALTFNMHAKMAFCIFMTPILQGEAGSAVQYITRNQALKKLQLKLSEFRRLCILKGIYPREPKKKVHGANKTYYHVKDVSFLLHEPLLKKVRELAAYDKKVRKALAKKNRDLAQRLSSRRPGYRLDHLVRERYPSFIDALRDLDDPLTLIHLFAVLPADSTHGIPSDSVHLSRRLALEWQAWVVRAKALRKVFVSVKGYYYQAEVQGQAVTWLVPHQLTQVLPTDVDFKVMLTFLELYQTTLRFVLFKLYHSLGLKYPPTIDAKLEEEAAAGLQAVLADEEGTLGAQQGLNRGGNHPAESDKDTIRKSGGNPQGEDKKDQEGKDANSEAVGVLSAKVAALEAEIKGMVGQEGESNSRNCINGGDEFDQDADLEIYSEDEIDDEIEAEGDDDRILGSEIPMPGTQAALKALDDKEVDLSLMGGAVGVDIDDDGAVCSTLFQGLVFFLGREVPREQLLLVIRAFGGEVGWAGEGSRLSEDCPRITHQISDRPMVSTTSTMVFENREVVQPQWVFDSANARVLVRPSLYAPGMAPPPHLSPFVVEDEEGYVPEYGREIKELQKAARLARQSAAGAAEIDAFRATDGGAVVTEAGDELRVSELRHAAELAQELRAGGNAVQGIEAAVQAVHKRARETVDDADEEAMKDIMMTRKVRKLYNRVKVDRAAKKARVEELEAKAAALGQKK